MELLLLIAALSGALSVLTPCVLPLLPALLTVSSANGKRRVAGLVIGIVASFVTITLLLGTALTRLGLPPRTFEVMAAVFLIGFGLILAIAPLERAFQRVASRAASKVPQFGRSGDGFLSGLASGSTLGLVWAPCAGPILAGVTVAAGVGGFGIRTVAVAVAYGLGMLVPLTAICLGGQRVGMRLRASLGGGQRVLVPMGIILIVTGIGIGSGYVTKINREVSERISFTSTPIKALEERALERERTAGVARASVSNESGVGAGETPPREELEASGYPEPDGRFGQGPAPALRGIEKWFNTPQGKPLSLDKLRGKVVLIDFWTYSCINCIRTIPHLRKLHDKYQDRGLVVIGVHTPEFAFERDHTNIRKAIDDLGVSWPVAVDNEYQTWKNYYNRYWPAHYLIDADGNIQQVHYGEGAYDETSELVGELLDERDASMGAADQVKATKPVASGAQESRGKATELLSLRDPDQNSPRTPETYLGFARADRFAGISRGENELAPNARAQYTSPSGPLEEDQWSLSGDWTVRDERAIAGKQALLRIAYQARDVYLVLGPEKDSAARTGTLTVRDGNETRQITLKDNRLYVLKKGDSWARGEMEIAVPEGFAAYAFTFG